MIKEIKERGELFKSLDETEDELVRLVSSFNERQINMIPYTGSWTAAQVTEHITRSNLGIIRSLKTQGHPVERDIDAGATGLRETFLNFETKLQSPKFILPTRDIYNKETILGELKQSIDELKEIGHTVNLSEAIDHPIFGEITKLELHYFVTYHTQRHIHQLRNIVRHTS